MVRTKLVNYNHVAVNNSCVKFKNCRFHGKNSKPSEKFSQCATCQRDLVTSLRKNNIEAFLRHLRNGADVNCKDSVTNYSVFELACKTPCGAKFIIICIAFGAQINKINPCHDQFPVHLAAESNDEDNLSALLSAQDLLIDNQNENNLTALCMLFERIAQENYNNVWNCIKLLLEYHANINTTNSEQKTPIQLVLENESLSNDKKTFILQYCLSNYYCNVDENTKSLIQAIYPYIKIPEYTSKHELFDHLRDILNSETIEKFIQICQERYHSIAHLDPEMIRKLLQITIYRGKLEAAQTLLELKNVEREGEICSKLLAGLLKKCCTSGEFKILQLLLDVVPEDNVDFVNRDPLLSIVVKEISLLNEKTTNRFHMCLDLLLDDRRVEIDKRDGLNRTALQYAGILKNNRAQRLLLAKGAYVGGEDLAKNQTIVTLNPDVLKKHLDSCVTVDFEALKVNCTNLVPPEFKSEFKEHLYRHSNDASFHHPLSAILNLIEAKMVKHAQIIHHPVISCWLQVHWLNLLEVFWINAMINLVHFVSLSAYALRTTWTHLFYSVSSASLLVILLIEGILVQRNFKSRVFYLPDNFKNMMFITSTWFLINSGNPIAAYAPLMAGINFIISLDGITNFQITRQMILLLEVLKNMFMCIMPCVLVLLSFAISFHTLLKNKSNTQEVTSEMDSPEGSENKTTLYSGDATIVTQITTMATKIVAGEIRIDEDPNCSILVGFYLLFLICVIIVLFNKLTASIRCDHSCVDDRIKLKLARRQVRFLIHYEKAFTRKNIMNRVNRIIIKLNEQNKTYIIYKQQKNLIYKQPKLLDVESPMFRKDEQHESELRPGRKMDDRIVWALQNTVRH